MPPKAIKGTRRTVKWRVFAIVAIAVAFPILLVANGHAATGGGGSVGGAVLYGINRTLLDSVAGNSNVTFAPSSGTVPYYVVSVNGSDGNPLGLIYLTTDVAPEWTYGFNSELGEITYITPNGTIRAVVTWSNEDSWGYLVTQKWLNNFVGRSVFDNLTVQVHPGGLPSYLRKDVEVMRGDMRDLEAVRCAVDEMEVIFHFAATVGVGQSMYEIARYMEVNTQGTANLLQALLDRKVNFEKLVVASSMSIYGEGQYRCAEHGEVAPPPRELSQLRAKQWETCCPVCGRELAPLPTTEDKPLQCTSIYALSKKDQEEMTLLFGRTYNLPVVALRYFNIYGTRQALSNPYTGVAAIFASRLLNGHAPMIFEDGRQQRDFVSVDDVVQANLLAMERSEADGTALNVGSGEAVTINDVAAVLARALGVHTPAEITGKYRAGDIRHCFADISRARRLLGYEPKHRFSEGVSELVGWLREQTAVDRVQEAALELSQYGLTA